MTPLEEVIESAVTAGKVPGAALGEFDVDGERFAFAGVADAGTGRPIDEETPLRWASVSKLVTATAVHRLVAEGRVDLHAPLDAQLPGLRLAPGGPAPTVAQLLAHVSGLESELPSLAAYGEGDDALSRLAADCDRVRRLAAPGAVYGYCNVGFWLLGALVVHVAGAPFEEAARELVPGFAGEFADPAGMERLGAARGHAADGRPVDASWAMPRARRPSGGVVGSIATLAAYGRQQLRDAQREPLAAPWAPIVACPDGSAYGRGWSCLAGGAVVGHGGSYHGFRAGLWLSPRSGRGMAVLANGAGAEALLERLLAVAFPETARGAELRVRGARGPRLSGTYASVAMTARLEVDGAGGVVRVSEDDGTEYSARVDAIDNGRFLAREGPRRGRLIELLPAQLVGGPELMRIREVLLARVADRSAHAP